MPGFHLVQLLGRGGFGEVWKAMAPGRTEVALKIISLEDKQGFKEFRAIKTVKNIHNAHLVPIVAIWLKDRDGRLFMDGLDDSANWKGRGGELIVEMSLGDKNLLDRLHECTKEGLAGIPPDELLDYLEDAAKAIDFLNRPIHNLGSGPAAIQHCDIKPQNLMIVGGSVQVCDFGLARILNEARITATAMTVPYTPPELFKLNQPSATTDQYSLAISYVELRTGKLPFESETQAHIIYAHIYGKLDLSRLPPAEQEVIRRATALDPTARYPTTLAMVKALRRACTGVSGPASLVEAVEPPSLTPGTELVPGYCLVERKGRGGYGEVWEAVAPGGKRIALKIVSNLKEMSGKQEFKALELIKGVEHNHLLELHAYWLLDEKWRVIPDKVRQEASAPAPQILVIAGKLAKKNLAERLQECRQEGQAGIPVPELLGYMRQAAQAIDYLNKTQHQLDGRLVSIQHRDIKPENILIAADTIKVGDFGLAKVVEGTEAEIRRDSEGLTLGYAAPEIYQNRVTAWSDQYALAITYFRLRTGMFPFVGNPMVALLQGLDFGALPAAEQRVLARATAMVPEERFPSCLALVEGLEAACAEATAVGQVPLEGRAPFPQTQAPAAPASRAAVTRPLMRHSIPPPQRAPVGQKTAYLPTVAPDAEPDDDFETLRGTVAPEGLQASITPPTVEPGPPPRSAPSDRPVEPPAPSVPAPAVEVASVLPAPRKRRGWPSLRLPKIRIRKQWAATGAAVLTLFLLTVGGVRWVRQAREELERAVQQRIDQGEYSEALADLGTAGFPQWFFRDGYKDRVRDAWVAYLQDLEARHAPPENLHDAVVRFREHFADHPEGHRIYQAAQAQLIPRQVQSLLAQGQYAQAFALVEQADLDGSAKGRLQEEVATAWIRDVVERVPPLFRRKEFEAGLTVLNQLPEQLRRDRRLAGLFQQAQQGLEALRYAKLLAEMDELIAGERFAAAAQFLKDHDTEFTQPDRQARREAIATGWKDQIQLAVKAQKTDAQGACNDYLRFFPEDTDVKSFLAELAKPRPEAIAQMIRAAEDFLDQGKLAEAREGFREAMNSLKPSDGHAEFQERCSVGLARVFAHSRPPKWDQAKKELQKAGPGELTRVYGQSFTVLEQITKNAAKPRSRALLLQHADWLKEANRLRQVMSLGKWEREQLGAAATRLFQVLREAIDNQLDERPARLVLDDLVQVTDTLVAAEPDDARVKGLRGYMLALREGQPAAAAERLLAVENLLAVLDRGDRKEAAGEILRDAANSRWTKDAKNPWVQVDGKQAYQRLWANDPPKPWSPAEAKDAFRWLSKANEIASLPADLQIRRVIAARDGLPAQPQVARDLAAQAKPLVLEKAAQLEPREVYEVLLVHAQTQEDTRSGWEVAIASSADLLDLIEKNNDGARIPGELLFQRVVKPATETWGPKVRSLDLTETLKKRLARCYRERGKLINDNLYAPWVPAPAPQEALSAYDQAVKLAPGQPENYIGRAYARIHFPDPDLSLMRQDAEAAQRFGPKLAKVHGLLGYVQIEESRREADPPTQIKTLERAIASYDDAIRLVDPQQADDALPIFFLDRSEAYLELGNFDASRRAEAFRKAKSDAEEAVRLRDRLPHPEWAWEALGNALEDLAWLLNQRSEWPGAVDAFKKAITIRGDDQARYWLNLGRCQYRWVRFGGKEPAYLQEAIQSSKNALARKLNVKEAADANDWLALAYLLQGRYQDADQCFAKAAAIPSQPTRAWYAYGVQFAGRTLDEWRMEQPPRKMKPEAWEHLLQAVQQRLQRVRTIPLKGTADLEREAGRRLLRSAVYLGRVYEDQKDPVAALKTYDAQLPALARLTSDHVELMVARINLLLTKAELQDALKKKKQLPDAEALAEYAEKAVELAADALKARALGAAGSARAAINRDPTFGEAKQRKARTRAVAHFREALKRGPKENRAFVWRVELAVQLKDAMTDRGAKLPSKTWQEYQKEALRELDLAAQEAPTQWHKLIAERKREIAALTYGQ